MLRPFPLTQLLTKVCHQAFQPAIVYKPFRRVSTFWVPCCVKSPNPVHVSPRMKRSLPRRARQAPRRPTRPCLALAADRAVMSGAPDTGRHRSVPWIFRDAWIRARATAGARGLARRHGHAAPRPRRRRHSQGRRPFLPGPASLRAGRLARSRSASARPMQLDAAGQERPCALSRDRSVPALFSYHKPT